MLIKSTKKAKLFDVLYPINTLVDVDEIIEINPIIIDASIYIDRIENAYKDFLDDLQANKIYIQNKPYLVSVLKEAVSIEHKLNSRLNDIGRFTCHLALIYDQHMNNFLLDEKDKVAIDYELWDKRNEAVFAYEQILKTQINTVQELCNQLYIFIGSGTVEGCSVAKRRSTHNKIKTIALEWALANIGFYEYSSYKNFQNFLEQTTTYTESGKECTIQQVAVTIGQLRKLYLTPDSIFYTQGQHLDSFTKDVISSMRSDLKQLDDVLASIGERDIIPPNPSNDVFPIREKSKRNLS